eukprot:9089502-Pyramimonas_sp.AAC.1
MTVQGSKTLIDIPDEDATTHEGAASMLRNSHQTCRTFRTFDVIRESKQNVPFFKSGTDVQSNIQCLDRLPHRTKTHMYLEERSNPWIQSFN